MDNIASLAKAFFDPSRPRILLVLQEHEVPVSILSSSRDRPIDFDKALISII